MLALVVLPRPVGSSSSSQAETSYPPSAAALWTASKNERLSPPGAGPVASARAMVAPGTWNWALAPVVRAWRWWREREREPEERYDVEAEEEREDIDVRGGAGAGRDEEVVGRPRAGEGMCKSLFGLGPRERSGECGLGPRKSSAETKGVPCAWPGSDEDSEGFGLEGAMDNVGIRGVGAV